MPLNRASNPNRRITSSDVEALRDHTIRLIDEHRDAMTEKIRSFRKFFARRDEENAREARDYWNRRMDKALAELLKTDGKSVFSGPLPIEIHDSEEQAILSADATMRMFEKSHDNVYMVLSKLTKPCDEIMSDRAWALVNGTMAIFYNREIQILNGAVSRTKSARFGNRVRAASYREYEETSRILRLFWCLEDLLWEGDAGSLLSSVSAEKLASKINTIVAFEGSKDMQLLRRL